MKNKIIAISFLALMGSQAAFASNISKIELGERNNKTILTIHHDGEGKFRYFSSERMSSVIVEAQELSIPSKLTKVIQTSSATSPVIQVTPYSAQADGRPMAKIVLQVRGAVELTGSEVPGKFILELGKKKFAGLVGKKPSSLQSSWSETDSIASRSGAADKAAEVAEKLVAVLNSQPDKKEYFGSKVTFEGAGVEVHDIFRLVGEASGLNIVSDTDVKYTSTISVKDVPWDQLLDIVVQQAQLRAAVSGNVVRIVTADKYNKEQEFKIRQLSLEDALEPISMAVIPLSFAPAEDIKKMIDTLMVQRKTGAEDESGVLASSTPAAPTPSLPGAPIPNLANPTTTRKPVQDFARGRIEIDARSNSLVITNTREAIERIRRLIKELDVALPQVLIDSKVIIATESFSRGVGVRWGGRATSSGTGRAGAGAGFQNGVVSLGDSAAAAAPTFNIATSTNEVFGFQIGAGRHGNLNAALQLAEVSGVSKTVASPRVIVNNKKTATISDGQTIIIATLNAQGSSSTTLSPRLSLTVTPQVTADNSVLLRDLTITKGSVAAGASTPTTNDKTITTEVLVDSGSTLVLGGVYQFENTDSDSGIPLLKDLPFLGHLFKTNSVSSNKSELMVFITPQIIESTPGKDPSGSM